MSFLAGSLQKLLLCLRSFDSGVSSPHNRYHFQRPLILARSSQLFEWVGHTNTVPERGGGTFYAAEPECREHQKDQ